MRACHVATQNYKHTVPVVGNGKKQTLVNDNEVNIEMNIKKNVCVYI